MPVATDYLPAEKLSLTEILQQHQDLLHSDLLVIADVLPIMVVILNDHRQIVYANARLLSFLGYPRLEAVLGMRLGEALGCQHHLECAAECGTTTFCRHCGAAKAIVASLEGGSATRECELNRKDGNILTALNLQVWMYGIRRQDRMFSLGVLIDIFHEKQLHVFERLFYHDILNTSGIIKGICEIFDGEGDIREYLDVLRRASLRLIEQIASHKEFMMAERQELAVHPLKMGSRMIVEEQVELFQVMAQGKGVRLVRGEVGEDLFLMTDRTLLCRALSNLIKNALEASGPGDVVSVECRAADGGVLFEVRNPAVLTEAVRAGLFKRAFSTKGMGRGLGSYSAKLFVEKYLQGRIWFESSQEQGTVFFILLPAVLAA